MKGSGGSPAPSAQAKGSSLGGGSALAAPGAGNNDMFGKQGYTDTLA